MSKLNPKRFDEWLSETSFKWRGDCLEPSKWNNIEFIIEYGDYYLYYAYCDNGRDRGTIYRTKIENVGEEDEEYKTNIIEIDGKKYKLVEVEE